MEARGRGAGRAIWREIETARTLRLRGIDDLDGRAGRTGGGARAALLAALDRREPAAAWSPRAGPRRRLREADDLSALAAARRRGSPAPASRPAARRWPLRWPVAGDVTRAFGEPDAAGVRRARPDDRDAAAGAGDLARRRGGALRRAVSRLRARRRAGPGARHSDRAGGRRDARGPQTGDALRAGDPIGLLGGRTLDAQEYLMLGNAGVGRDADRNALYRGQARTGPGRSGPAVR